MQIMITDGGPHPPDKWAQVTTQTILDDITANAPQTGVGEAQDFRRALEELLTDHHGAVQSHERRALEADMAHLATPLDPAPHLERTVQAIVALARQCSFAGYFERPETQEYLRRTIGTHFATAMHVERAWRADRGEDEHAAAFRRQYHSGAPTDQATRE